MKLQRKWLDVITFVSAYLGAIPFALVGGYRFLKMKDEETKKTLKLSLIVFLSVLAANALIYFLDYFFVGICSIDGFYRFLAILRYIVNIGEIAAYAVLVILSVFKGSSEEVSFDKDPSID